MFRSDYLRTIAMTLLLGVAAVGLFAACSKSSDGPTSNSYSGPGSKWDTTLRSDGTFTIVKYASPSATTADFTVDGTYTTTTTGFKRLVVTTVSGTGGPAVGEVAYGLEIPGYVFALKPLSGDQLIPMVISGACPTADFDANWVIVNKDDAASLATLDVAGTFHYDFASVTPTLPIKYDVNGTSLGAGTVGTGTSCASGIMAIDVVDLYLTNSGGAIVNTNRTDSTKSNFIFAFKQTAITTTASLDGNYAGLVFFENSTPGSQVAPVKLVCSGGVCTGTELSDVVAGSTTGPNVTITLLTPDNPGTGLVLGTISNGGTAKKIVCMIDKNAASSGKTIGSCVGQDPGDATKMFNVLFTSI